STTDSLNPDSAGAARASPCQSSAMSYQTIEYETRGRVALITLNRPDKLNAWTPQMASEQAAAINAAGNDPDVGAIVMSGARPGRGRALRARARRADRRQPPPPAAHDQAPAHGQCRGDRPRRGAAPRERADPGVLEAPRAPGGGGGVPGALDPDPAVAALRAF